MPEHASPSPNWVERAVDRYQDEVVALRRQLHAHPELSGEEYATTELIAERLRVAGLEPRVLTRGTGLVCDINPPEQGKPLVVLRADIDALAMTDEKDVPYRSQNDGVAHACGHDAHAAMVLGAGLVLAASAHWQASRSVRLVFEPAEETVPGGAVDVIAEGALDGATSVFALHCDPRLDTGQVGVRRGALTAAADMVEIRLHGPGGHTARPELTVDLVAVAARVAVELPALLTARSDPVGSLRLVFGSIVSGDAANVIPTTARLRASLRTHDVEAWAAADTILRECVHELVASTGAEVEVEHLRGVPPVVNDGDATALLANAARRVVGDDGVREAERSWGGDSFAWYLDEVPGSYGRLGVHPPGSDDVRVDLHAGHFDIDERALRIGVQVLVQAAVHPNAG